MTDNAPHATDTHKKYPCDKLPDPPTPPTIPERGQCPQPCNCPPPPGGPPSSCLDDLIRCQSIIVKKADRAKAFVDELTVILDKVTSAQVDYTQARFKDLRKTWKEQDKAIAELIRKLVCAVCCWECLLECRLCPQLVEIRTLEDRLNGTGMLTKKVYSLFDLQAWHQRNVANMQARVDRIKLVLDAWVKPSDTLGDALDKNGKLIKDTEQIIATESAKAVYDVFMTLLPRHWAIRPRDLGPNNEWASEIDTKYLNICECKEGQQKGEDKGQDKGQDKGYEKGADKGHHKGNDKDGDEDECDDDTPDPHKCRCDDGAPDDCCGPDVGILSLRQRLIGPLPYIVDPALFPDIICCITTERLSSASDQLARAQADLDATTADIDLAKKRIADKMNGIEANFRAELPNPIDCSQYQPKEPQKKDSPTTGGAKQTEQTAR